MKNVSEYVLAIRDKSPIDGSKLVCDAYDYVNSEGAAVYADFPSLTLYRSLFQKANEDKAYTNLLMSMDMMALVDQVSHREDKSEAFTKDFSEMRTNLRLGKLHKELYDIFATIPGLKIGPTYFLDTIALSLFRKIKGITVQFPKTVRLGSTDEEIKVLVDKYNSIVNKEGSDFKVNGIYQGRFDLAMVDKKIQCQFNVEVDLNGERDFITFAL